MKAPMAVVSFFDGAEGAAADGPVRLDAVNDKSAFRSGVQERDPCADFEVSFEKRYAH
jgi:hypothetical protein